MLGMDMAVCKSGLLTLPVNGSRKQSRRDSLGLWSQVWQWVCRRLENTAYVQHRELLAFSTHGDSSCLVEDSPGGWRATSIEKRSDLSSSYLPSVSLTGPVGINGFNWCSFPSPWLHTASDCLQSSPNRIHISSCPTRVPPKEKEYLFEAMVFQATRSLKPLPPSPVATSFFHPHTYSPSPELSMSPPSSATPPSSLSSFPT